MKKVNTLALTLATLGVAKLALGQAHTVTGTVDQTFYGNPLAIQTINTGFGDDTSGNGTSGSGSELDSAYATVSNGSLYVFLAGNFQGNGNHVDLFIDDGRAGGTNTLAAGSSGFLNSMNGSIFSPGFNATYCLDANDFQGILYLDQYDFVKTAGNYLGQVNLTNGVGANQNLSGIAEAINNTNAAGVNGNTGTAADTGAASTVTTGIEFGIPLTALGNPTGTIKILADVNGNNDAFLSNQFLPGLPVGTGNVGGGGSFSGGQPGAFNLSTTTNFWFSATQITVPNGVWAPTGNGSWSTSSNWSNNIVPGNPGDTAVFTSATGPTTVTLDGNRTVGTISFNSSNSYTIAPGTGGALTMDNGTGSANVEDFGGSHTIAANVTLASNTLFDVVNHGDFLTISGNISGPGQLAIKNLGGGGSFAMSAVILSGNNTYGGGTLITGGNLQLGSATAIPAGSSLTFDATDVPNPVLDLNGNGAVLGSIIVLTGPQTVTVGAHAQIINQGASGTATVTYAGSPASVNTFLGTISDNSGGGGASTSLHIASGSLVLMGDSTYAGPTIIDGGATLTVNSSLRADFTLGPGLPANNAVVNNGALNISGAASTLSTVTGTGNLTVSGNVFVTASSISQKSLTINDASHVALNSGGTATLTTLNVGDNSPDTSAQFDVNDGGVLLTYSGSSPIAAIRGLIGEAFDNGNWDQNGITSTAAHNDPSFQHGLGYVDSGLSLTIKYTQYGDGNLDGTVNSSDFQHFLDGIANGGSTWLQGDYTYDGVVDLGNDFALFLENYLGDGNSPAELGAIVEASSLSATQKASLLALVPEPSSIAMLAIGAGALATRRRRK
jgi:fibronectin-binding autotransporter adhesin